jgi:MFS family permease
VPLHPRPHLVPAQAEQLRGLRLVAVHALQRLDQQAPLHLVQLDAAVGERGRQVSWMFGMDNLGMLIGPVVGGFIAGAWGPRAPFGVYALLALLALVPTLLFAPDSPRRDRNAHAQASAAAPAPSHPTSVARSRYGRWRT